jgi:hypothetical protein
MTCRGDGFEEYIGGKWRGEMVSGTILSIRIEKHHAGQRAAEKWFLTPFLPRSGVAQSYFSPRKITLRYARGIELILK